MKIYGTGSALPKRVVTNDDLAAFLDTSDEWISTRTGIRERRVLSEETLQSLAERAGAMALSSANVAPEAIDYVLVSTVQAETLTPALACDIQPALGLKCMGMDLNAGCTGFIAALAVADAPGRVADVRAAVAALRVHLLPAAGEDGLRKMQRTRHRGHCVLTARFLV